MDAMHGPVVALALVLSLAACDHAATDVAVASLATAPASAGTPAAAVENPVDAESQPAARAADARDDTLIAAKVTTGLAADRSTSAMRIQVDSNAGVVTLRGPAPSAAARARAEEIARNVQGVTSVRNQLDVQAG